MRISKFNESMSNNIYSEIYKFCKVRNKGTCRDNGTEITPRVEFIISILDKYNIKYEIDEFDIGQNYLNRSSRNRRDRFSRDNDRFSRDRFNRDSDNDRFSRDRFNRDSDNDRFGRDRYRFEMEISSYFDEIESNQEEEKNSGFNIILRGSSDKMVVAHHDIVNPNSDNANDNSASVINAIALKKLVPEINVVLLDGEEVGGLGSQRLSDSINSGDFGKIDWVLNLELSGKGGDNFFIGNYPGKLFNKIKSQFDCPVFNTPFNDSVIFRQNNIDSVVINPVPILDDNNSNSKRIISNIKYRGKNLDTSILFNCHSIKDSINTISVEDMKIFVEEVLLKIVK